MGTEIKTVDRLTKQYLILLACREIPGQDYHQMQHTVKQFQNVLIKKYGYNLGYDFNDSSVLRHWDNNLQKDIERYEGIELLLTPQLCLNNEIGRGTLERLGVPYLEQFFNKKGIIEELSKELRSIKEN